MMSGSTRAVFCLALLSACGAPSDGTDGNGGDQEPLADWRTPRMVVGPSTVDFGVHALGLEAVEAVWVHNEGDAPLEITDVVLDGSVSFSVLDAPELPVVVDPGEQVLLDVVYAPASVGEAGRLTVFGTDEHAPSYAVNLRGSQSVPELLIEPKVLEFGEVPLGCEVRTTALLRSVGTEPVTVHGISLGAPGFAVVDAPEFPIVLEAGESAAVEVRFRPVEDVDYPGLLLVDSNDLALGVADLFGSVQEGAPCEGVAHHDLQFVAEFQVVDIALLLDTTSPTVDAFALEFSELASSLATDWPDITFGLATFDDYNQPPFGDGDDKPFRLVEQQTVYAESVAAELAGMEVRPTSVTLKSAHEAIYQAVVGNGYDQDCDGSYDSTDDIKASVASPFDAFDGFVAGELDAAGAGMQGGMGFRDRVLPILIVATDKELRDPDAGDASPGGCSQDASFYEAYLGMAERNTRFIGVGTAAAPSKSQDQLTNLAIVSGSYSDVDGDFVHEPAVLQWIGHERELRIGIRDAVMSMLESHWFEEVSLVAASDPLGLVVQTLPEAHGAMRAGAELDFTVTVAGTLVDGPTVGSEMVELELVANGELVLSRHTLHIVP
jgi:hypothetical protein